MPDKTELTHPTKEEIRDALRLNRFSRMEWTGMLLNIGVVFVRCGDYEVAERIFKFIVMRDQNHAASWYNLYVVYKTLAKMALQRASSVVDSGAYKPTQAELTEKGVRPIEDCQTMWKEELEKLDAI